MSKMTLKSSMRLKQRRKAGDPWVSTNRVLNGLGKKSGNIGRNPNFDTDETKLLIQLWGDPKVQRALITTHKKHAVISQLAQKMQDYGYFRSPEEITTRIKNLKCFYNRIKKDIETSQDLSSRPGWKHFAEMDAIMTRPIFSVRPDEIPAPSLKFRLEQAREERAERRKQKQTEGTLASDPLTDESDDFMDDDSFDMEDRDQVYSDGIVPDVEVDIDVNREAFTAVAKQAQTIKLAQDNVARSTDNNDPLKEELAQVKNEDNNDANVIKTETKNDKSTVEAEDPLLIEPKMEPIDVDVDEEDTEGFINMEEDNVETNNTKFSTLADMFKISKDKNVSINAVNSTQVLLPATSTIIASNSSTITTTAVATTAATLNSVQTIPGKISLVPTNFLMQPNKNLGTRLTTSTGGATITQQPQQIHLLQSSPALQSRLLFNGTPTSQNSTSSTNTGIMTNGPGGMKVLLLSAEQAAANSNNFSKKLGTLMPFNANTMLMQSQLQSVQQQQIVNAIKVQQQQQQQQHQQQQQVTSASTTTTTTLTAVPTTANSTKTSLLTDEKLMAARRNKLLQQQQQQQTLKSEQQSQYQQQQSQQQQSDSPLTKKDATNLRILLRQLLNAQFESNAINSRRWKVERDRLEFEKSLSERFFTALPNFLDTLKDIIQPAKTTPPPPPPSTTQQQPTPIPVTTTTAQTTKPQIFQATPFMTVSSAGTTSTHLRLQPPKLLFTAVRHPTIINTQNTISIASPSSSPLIAKQGSTIETNVVATTTTQAHLENENALLVPKEEPLDN